MRALRFVIGLFARLPTPLRRWWPRSGIAAIRTRLRGLGIATRLTVAFAAVGLLAVTANLLAEHGAAIVQIRSMEPAAAPLPPPRIATVAETGVVLQRASTPVLTPEELLAAAARYDRAVARRMESQTPASTAEPRFAATQMQAELTRFVASARAADVQQEQLVRLSAQVAAFRERGEELVVEADRRRALFAEYWDCVERLDARVKGSLDRNWKIFGRVIARQSLISLSRDLDNIRRDSARLSPAGMFDKDVLGPLTSSQERFAAAVEENAAGLTRSQGSAWLTQLRNELSQVISTRTVLVLTDEHATRTKAAMEHGTTQIGALLRSMQVTPVVTVATAPQAAAAPAPVNGHPSLTPTQGPIVSTDGADSPVTISSTTLTPSNRGPARAQVIVAAVSGAVLIVLLVICVSTVRSIVIPIRRFIVTTRKLSAGAADARVELGGIRELDTLAVAFNDMATRLATAQSQMREYQAQLEDRVDERTRQLQHQAEHDSLTNLPNRRQLLRYLQATLRRAELEERLVGVFFLDLDNFKNINDSMGHAFGDRVLQAIAQRLREATESGGFAARLGGDEFTVVHDAAGSVEEICRIGGRLVHAFQKPLLVDGRELLVGISVGASVYPEHERDGDALLRAADAALFQAKTAGRSQMSLFNPAMLEAATLKFRIEQGLRRAVDRGEFELLYQPEVSFDCLDTQLVEALLRWRLPDGRNVAPGEFLAVAEESGLITSISDWVLSSAIAAAAKWHHGVWPGVRVAINVSARQLLDARFVERVQELMQRHDVPASCIEIELTETVLQTGPATIQTLHRLRELGIAIALDDFGTGYSSLASLEKLPLTRLKLDRSLIASIHTSPRSLAITRAIVSLCRSLGLAVTAEGIETSEQLATLLEFPSLCMQGYLIAPPTNADSLTALVTEMPARLQSLLLSLPNGAARAKPSQDHGLTSPVEVVSQTA